MGIVQSHFAGMLANPLRSDAPEGSPISGNAAVPTAQIFRTTTEVAQKRKFCEDQDSALGPPTKISRGTSLVFQASSIGIQQIPHVPLVTSSLKRKNSEDHDLALGPPAKVPRTTSLISPRGHACLIWRLPNELLGHITSFLPLNSLLALTQVCQLLREIAAPRCFVLLGFDTPQSNYLSLDDKGCKALLVWRRTGAFVVPNSLHFSVSRTTTDYHLYALRTFFESLTGSKVIPRVHLLLYSGPDKPSHSFLCLLECIRGSGCKELSCHGLSWGEEPRICRGDRTSICDTEIESLELSSSLFFTSMSIAFTLSTLRSAPLVSLRLTNTALTAVQWTKFLRDLRFRSLRSLEIETTCPARSLVEFLSRHQVKALAIISSTLEYLGLRLGASSFTDCFLSDVLLCAEHLSGVNELSIRFPAEADPFKGLTLWILNSESDDNTIPRDNDFEVVDWSPPPISRREVIILYTGLKFAAVVVSLELSVLNCILNGTLKCKDHHEFFWIARPPRQLCLALGHAGRSFTKTVLNSLISLSLSSTKLPYSAIFFFYLDDMSGGRLPGFKMSRQFRFHPYARVKPSAREIVALYDDTYNEDHTIPSSSATSDSGTASVSGRLSSYKLSRQYRYHPYTRMKPSAREIVTGMERSPRFPSKSFVELAGALHKKQAGLYIQLHTGHAPLNQRLHRLKKLYPHSNDPPHRNEVSYTTTPHVNTPSTYIHVRAFLPSGITLNPCTRHSTVPPRHAKSPTVPHDAPTSRRRLSPAQDQVIQ
ncbi:hypothetical protein F5141DRAFT_1061634 [Pisolithus sp. B1]|nr:hypothetical protein F5141DRAFT_1061634 [Pisolithus sp. B1]